MQFPLELLINDFAIRSFRDQADQDYIAARMACRAGIVTPYLWSSQQAIEKYLKCILLLNRIPAKDLRHNLGLALKKISSSGTVILNLKQTSLNFIEYLDAIGRFRYFEVSNFASAAGIINLDRAVWELRRFCSSSDQLKKLMLEQGVPAPRIRITGGYLEQVIDARDDAAREPLLWQNAYFGKRKRKKVRLKQWMKASNSPLYLHPEILNEVLKFVYLPKEVVEGYRNQKDS